MTKRTSGEQIMDKEEKDPYYKHKEVQKEKKKEKKKGEGRGKIERR